MSLIKKGLALIERGWSSTRDTLTKITNPYLARSRPNQVGRGQEPQAKGLSHLKRWAGGGAQRQRDEAIGILKGHPKPAAQFNAWRARNRFEMLWLVDADLTGLNLEGVNFTNTFLQQANFSNTKLEGALFEKAQIEGASFSGAIFKTSEPGFIPAGFGEANQELKDKRWAQLKNDLPFRASSFIIHQKNLSIFGRKRQHFTFEFKNLLDIEISLALWVYDGKSDVRQNEIHFSPYETKNVRIKIKAEYFSSGHPLELKAHMIDEGRFLPLRTLAIAGWPPPS